MSKINGRDPKIFLKEVFDESLTFKSSEYSAPSCWSWEISGKYVFMKISGEELPEKFLDKKTSNMSWDMYLEKWEGGLGIENLIERLKGRRVFSIIIVSTYYSTWCLKIIK